MRYHHHNFFLTNLDSILQLGASRPLTVEDVDHLPPQFTTKNIYENFQTHWQTELSFPEEQRSLWRALFKTTGSQQVLFAISLSGIAAGCAIVPPLILRSLSNHFSSVITLSTFELWILVALLLIVPFVGGICSAHSFVIFSNLAIVVRSALVPALYRKSLVLSNQAREEFSSGTIMNLFSVDLTNIQSCIQLFSDSLFAPAQLAVALGLVYREVGQAMFAGLGFVLILLPLLVALFVLYAVTKKRKCKIGDSRIKLMDEILIGIRIIKYYAWEKPFMGQVEDIRNAELRTLGKLNILMVAIVTCVVSVPYVLPIVIFYSFTIFGDTELNTTIAFTTLALLGLVNAPMSAIPKFFQRLFAARISIARIFEFLQADELKGYIMHDLNPLSKSNKIILDIESVCAGWAFDIDPPVATKSLSISYEVILSDENKADLSDLDGVEMTRAISNTTIELNRSIKTLVDLNLTIHEGEVVAIIGSVGSGKSSVLSLLLGDLLLNTGRVSLFTTNIAYHSQQPWILNATVRENIICGLPLDEKRLKFAIEAACLRPDLKILPAGLDTEIGEKGINLSGGQRARISFARTVYRDSDLYLLDDPLSAVDAHVGDHIFHQGICTALKGKTVVLVTHQVHFLDECDRIIILRDGKIYAQGSPSELVRDGINYKEVIIHEDHKVPEAAETDDFPRGRARSTSTDHIHKSEHGVGAEGQLMTQEEKSSGQVSMDIYLWYFRFGGFLLVLFAILISLAGAGSYSYSAFYLSKWGKVAARNAMAGRPLSTEDNILFLNRYGLYSSMAIVSSTIRSIFFVCIGLRASKSMHNMLVSSVLKSPVAHFDMTPLGRILNRFTTDLTTTDETLATNLAFLLSLISGILGMIGSIAYTTKGMIFSLFCPLFIVYYYIQLYFRRTNTELKRLENITRSPIYSEFTQALSGVRSIRCHHLEEFFIKRMENFVDTNSGIWLIQQLIKWWLMMRLDTMGGMISFFLAALAAGDTLFIQKQYLGLSLQAAFSLVSTVKYLVSIWSEIEALMDSVERIKHYCDHIAPEETPDIIKKYKTDIPANWPQHGAILFKQVAMSYKNGPPVLKKIDLDIKPCERVGIAGRTGCGKSSLMVALYRLVNLQEGSIEIDGIDISTIPLDILRSQLGIIPQDPVIFSTVTVRFNLDPFAIYTDDQIWEVLDCVCMKETIQSLSQGLMEIVSEGGENFSIGQRQLICIARLLLRKPKILVMDESTSSIDNTTDTIIQNMIRNKFTDCTILTIAHRLHTVIDSDRILVMDRGHVMQFDSPKVLTKKVGLFSNLWSKHISFHSGKRLSKTIGMEMEDEEE